MMPLTAFLYVESREMHIEEGSFRHSIQWGVFEAYPLCELQSESRTVMY